MKLERLFEYSGSLASCGTQDEIKAVCKSFGHSLGFEHFIYGAYFPLVENIVILNGYPKPWREHYDSAGYMYSDPTVKHCSVNTSAIEWSQLDVAKGRRGAAEREIMNEAMVYGLRQGVSLPVHGPGAEWGMMSLSSSERYSSTLIEDTRFHTQFISQAAHEALKRVVINEWSSIVMTKSLKLNLPCASANAFNGQLMVKPPGKSPRYSTSQRAP